MTKFPQNLKIYDQKIIQRQTLKKLEKSILRTIAYFDIFAYPLTLIEIWKWLYFKEEDEKDVSLSDIAETLETSGTIRTLIDLKWGFYFLKDRESIVESRRDRYNLAEEKFGKAIRIIKFLKWMPGLKMIAVCNSLSWGNASDESDIDLFIITEKNKIWTSRFLAVVFLKLFGLRPRENKTKNKICLSFLVDEEHLNLEPLAVQSPDIYLMYWINQVVPIFDKGGVYQKFLDSNKWIKKFLPNIFNNEGSERRMATERSLSFKNRWSLLEKFLSKLQYKILPKRIKELVNRDTRVVVRDGILKFHCNDRREEYQKKWFQKIKELEQSL